MAKNAYNNSLVENLNNLLNFNLYIKPIKKRHIGLCYNDK